MGQQGVALQTLGRERFEDKIKGMKKVRECEEWNRLGRTSAVRNNKLRGKRE